MTASNGSLRPALTPLRGEALVKRAWEALESVQDPEIPAISIVELGLIRGVRLGTSGALEVELTPSYVGCPATEVIRHAVTQALAAAEIESFSVRNVLSPAWSSDWITAAGRRKLKAYGIVPPEKALASMRGLMRVEHPVGCPHCESLDTETVSEFGSTPCKALHRCRACKEPFERFKCI